MTDRCIFVFKVTPPPFPGGSRLFFNSIAKTNNEIINQKAKILVFKKIFHFFNNIYFF